jgi:hypothetical protein
VRSSVSIALFFLLSGFFLAALLGALEHKRKVLGIAAGCMAAIACIIVFLQPVQLPPTQVLLHGSSTTTTTAPAGPPGAGVDDGAARFTGAGAAVNDSPGPGTTTTMPGPGASTGSEVAGVG